MKDLRITQTAIIQNTPFKDWGAYASQDADMLHFIDPDTICLFHITTPDNAVKLMDSQPIPHACRIGFDGRETAKGFWLNNVPFIPYSIEQFMPQFMPDVDIKVLAYAVPVSVFKTLTIETTWPFAQFYLSEDLLSQQEFRPVEVTPADFLELRNPATMEKIIQYCRESLQHQLCPADGYVSKLIDAFDRLATQDAA